MAAVTLLQKWQLLQAILADAELPATAKVVAARMLDYLHTQTGRCCPSYQSLADGTGLKRRAIIYAAQDLEERRWIRVDRVKGGAATGPSRYATNEIQFDFLRAGSSDPTVHSDAPSRVHDDAPSTVHVDALLQDDNSAPSCTGGVHGGAPSTVHGRAPESGNTGKRTGKSLPHTPSRFDEWWETYPRRDGKIAARKAFDRILKNRQATVEELIAGAQRYAAARAGQDPKFTKVPTTWLNGGHWADEPPPPGGFQPGPTPSPANDRPSATAYLLARRARRLGHG
ncbi:helix-turn-helix domain-containing protein [Methylobacterium fujisawaense]